MNFTVVNLQFALQPGFHESIQGDYAHICVVSHDVENFTIPINKEFNKGLLFMRFDDIGYQDDDNMKADYSHRTDEPIGISDKQAEDIIIFMEGAVRNGINDILINCEAGISRSPGIAVALNQLYNNEYGEQNIQSIHLFGMKHANIQVRDKILQAHSRLYESGILENLRKTEDNTNV